MNIFKIGGKFLDQPLLVAKFNKAVPAILTASGVTYCAYKTSQASQDEKNSVAVSTSATMVMTIISALLAPKITNKIFNNSIKNIKEIKTYNINLIDKFKC